MPWPIGTKNGISFQIIRFLASYVPIRNVVATRYLPIEVLVHTYVQYILYEHELTVRRKKESNQSSNSKNQYQRTSLELYEVRTHNLYCTYPSAKFWIIRTRKSRCGNRKKLNKVCAHLDRIVNGEFERCAMTRRPMSSTMQAPKYPSWVAVLDEGNIETRLSRHPSSKWLRGEVFQKISSRKRMVFISIVLITR